MNARALVIGRLAVGLIAVAASGCLGELVILEEASDTGTPESVETAEVESGEDANGDGDGDDEIECRLGLTECEDACVDVRSDTAHCGGCEQPCEGFCVDGVCEVSCEAPHTQCGDACVDLATSVLHCEECGEACETNEICVQGKCRDFTIPECTSCPCECGEERSCCESTTFDAVLCVYEEVCPP